LRNGILLADKDKKCVIVFLLLDRWFSYILHVYWVMLCTFNDILITYKKKKNKMCYCKRVEEDLLFIYFSTF
jgi:hypothetical protein